MTGRSSEVTGQGDGSATGQVETALPFQDAAMEQRDLRFIRRFQPKPPASDSARSTSALSAPANFIAESPVKRTIRHLFSHRTWPSVTAGLALLVALTAIPVGLRLTGSPKVAEMAARGSEPSPAREQANPSASAGSGTAEALAGPARLLAIEPAAAAEGPPLALREEPLRSFAELADSGPEQPPSLFAFASPSTRITAFPPMLAPGAAPAEAEAAPVEQPEPARAAAKPKPDQRRLDALVERGNQLLSQGEIAGARLFFERAVAQDDPRGALGLARSYDSLVLKGLAVVGLSGNDAEAERWYRKARELGGSSAETTASTVQAER